MKIALILGGAGIDPIFLLSVYSPSNLVICADSGAEAALEAGIIPDIIIGDMDSVSPRTLKYFRRKGVRIITDPSEDYLDIELSILKAIDMGAERIIVLGAWGNRTDLSLASLGLLCPENIPLTSTGEKVGIGFQGEIYLVTEQSIVQRVRPENRIKDRPGRCVSLIPLPYAHGIITQGLRYELRNSNLSFGETMSVSNYLEQGEVKVEYDKGNLAMIRYFDNIPELEEELRQLTGKSKESDEDGKYLEVLREVFHHGGKVPSTPEGKEERLSFTRNLLDSLCPSHDRIRIIHIAGTTGKGSVAHYLHSILSRRFRTGLVISPHIHDFNERIQINGGPIPHSEVVRLWNGIKEDISGMEESTKETVLFQEIILVLAFEYFRENGVEWAVVETGLGGRFDQTRVLSPAATIITRIGLDHTHILGHTTKEIAQEKAGVIRQGIPVYTSEIRGEGFDVIKRRCDELSSPFHAISPENVRSLKDCEGIGFTRDHSLFNIPHPGRHQAGNAALAAAVSKEIVGLDEKEIQKGLESAELPGRIEIRGRLIVDTAHNPMELGALFSTLEKCLQKGKRCVVVCGFSDNKDHRGMLKEILNFADFVILTRAGYRGTEPGRLKELALDLPEIKKVKGILVEDEPIKAFRVGRAISGISKGKGYLIVTGSTFLMDEIFNPDEGLRRINSGE